MKFLVTPYGIYAYYNSTVFMGSSDSYNNRTGGYNSIPQSSTKDICVNNVCTVNADFNYWGTDNAVNYYDANPNYPYTSTFTHSNHISDPGAGSSLSKATVSEPNTMYAGYNGKKPNINKVSDLWLWAHELVLTDQIDEAIDIYQLLIKKFPESVEAQQSLSKLYHLSMINGKKDFKEYLNSLINAKKTPEVLRRTAYELIIGVLIQEEDFKSAINTCEKILKKYPDSAGEKNAFFDLVSLYQTNLHDTVSAQIYLEEMKRNYSGDELTLLAREAMGEEVNWGLFKPTIESEPVEIVLPEKFALGNNYPNPFNPMTTIEYDLPEDAKVTLTVYDIIGREVARLVNATNPAGFYKVIWDGKDKSGNLVSSGVYIYRIQAGSFTQTRKMVFIR